MPSICQSMTMHCPLREMNDFPFSHGTHSFRNVVLAENISLVRLPKERLSMRLQSFFREIQRTHKIAHTNQHLKPTHNSKSNWISYRLQSTCVTRVYPQSTRLWVELNSFHSRRATIYSMVSSVRHHCHSRCVVCTNWFMREKWQKKRLYQSKANHEKCCRLMRSQKKNHYKAALKQTRGKKSTKLHNRIRN